MKKLLDAIEASYGKDCKEMVTRALCHSIGVISGVASFVALCGIVIVSLVGFIMETPLILLWLIPFAVLGTVAVVVNSIAEEMDW